MDIIVDLENGFVDIKGCTYTISGLVSRFQLTEVDEDTVKHIVSEIEDLLDHLQQDYETIYI